MQNANQNRVGPGRLSPGNTRGFSLIELLIVVAIILIIVAIAIPNFLRSRMAANEAATAENLRTITTAAVVYNTTYGDGYPAVLTNLGGVATSAATCDLSVLIDDNLALVPHQKSGYTFAYTGESGNVTVTPANCGAPGFNGYLVTATPIVVGVSGTRSFCSDTPGILHFDILGNTPASPALCDALPGIQ